jgi:hypothetical protein
MLWFHSLASVDDAARTNNGELTGVMTPFDLMKTGDVPSEIRSTRFKKAKKF